MDIDDLSKKASEAAGKVSDFAKANADKIEDALKSEKAEEISDKFLDGAADLANKVTGGKHADKVQQVRDTIDKNIGDQ
ncbi:Rv0909 family putative TA system antitoxin [Leucobacter chinensis]|uniref:Rv0909 family putative TA system antitoxin n=1 Tax=Leucobacter chinensis TaxID=2851010 RepID=UPI001C2460A6|nr:Rv0909 family putative TA system antitoxin [Leucobacter chinensis]